MLSEGRPRAGPVDDSPGLNRGTGREREEGTDSGEKTDLVGRQAAANVHRSNSDDRTNVTLLQRFSSQNMTVDDPIKDYLQSSEQSTTRKDMLLITYKKDS